MGRFLCVFFFTLLFSASLSSAEIVFNEVYYRDLSENQWVELYNAGGSQVDIGGWILSRHSSPVQGEYFTIPQNTVLSPNKFLLLCADLEAMKASFEVPEGVESLEWGPAPTAWALVFEQDGDDIYLLDEERTAVDVMWYGDGGDKGPFQAAPSVEPEHSLGRFPDGQGTGVPSADFHDYRVPNPGVSNPPWAAVDKSTWGKIKALYSVRRG